MKYDPYTGIFGMDFYVVLGRPGKRVVLRKKCKSKLGQNQKVTKEEAIAWFKQRFDGSVV